MNRTIKDIAWVAGLLEGEGCFGYRHDGGSPCIWLVMTDGDVVKQARDILDPSKIVKLKRENRRIEWKNSYCLTLCGSIAIGWMMTLYPMMKSRRREKIREVVTAWKSKPRWGKVA